MLKFQSEYLKGLFYENLSTYLKKIQVMEVVDKSLTFKVASAEAVTKEARQKKLEMFFRVVFAQVSSYLVRIFF